jgi:2-iminobutanoate/2-iminopropanoate deaminase
MKNRFSFCAWLLFFPLFAAFPAWADKPGDGADHMQTQTRLPFSSIRWAGDTVYVSGTSAAPGQSTKGSIEDLTRQILENIQGFLAKEGLSLNDVVKTTVFLTNMKDFQAMNQTYARIFAENDQFPSRTTIGVKSLPFGAHIEIECIAYRGQKD